jgi:hypothetical protein
VSTNPGMDDVISQAVQSLAAGLGRMGAPMLGHEATITGRDGAEHTGIVDGIGLGFTRPDGSHHDGWIVELMIDGERIKYELDSAQGEELFGQFEPDEA